MKHPNYLLGFSVLSLLGLVYTAPVSADFKCWTNDEDVRECGSVIPPKYVKKGYKEMDSRAEQVKEQEAQKSPEELRKIKLQEREDEIKRKAAEQREKEDRALLDAYPIESDIILARDGKLASVEASVTVSKRQIEFFQISLDDDKRGLERNESKLKSYQRTSDKANIEETEKKISEVKAHILELEEGIERFHKAIADKREEQAKINATYEDYMQRHRSLRQRLAKERLQRRAEKAASLSSPATTE